MSIRAAREQGAGELTKERPAKPLDELGGTVKKEVATAIRR